MFWPHILARQVTIARSVIVGSGVVRSVIANIYHLEVRHRAARQREVRHCGVYHLEVRHSKIRHSRLCCGLVRVPSALIADMIAEPRHTPLFSSFGPLAEGRNCSLAATSGLEWLAKKVSKRQACESFEKFQKSLCSFYHGGVFNSIMPRSKNFIFLKRNLGPAQCTLLKSLLKK